MSIYIVVPVSSDVTEAIWAKIKSTWPKTNYFLADDRFALVAPTEATVVGEVMGAIGLGEDSADPSTGFVARIGPNNGWWHSDLWEWLERFEK